MIRASVALPLEDYALIGDTQTAALVGRDGSIDWLCLPRFDSGACFAALVGTQHHGLWRLAPAGDVLRVERRYRPGTLVLETDFHTAGGAVRIVDCMPPRGEAPDVVRLVEGLHGSVELHMRLVLRFDYGSIVPWVQRKEDALVAIAGPDAAYLDASVPTRGENFTTRADFTVGEGETETFVLTWHDSHLPRPRTVDARAAVADTDAWWRAWSAQSRASEL